MKRVVVPTLLLITMLLAACGGGDDSSTTSQTQQAPATETTEAVERLSADDYRAQATEICTTSEEATDALAAPQSAEELGPFLHKGLEITETAVNDYAELSPPEDLQDQHDAAVAAIRAQLAQIQALTDEIDGGADAEQAVKAAEPKLDASQKEVDKVFTDLGLEACADDSSSSSSDSSSDTSSGTE